MKKIIVFSMLMAFTLTFGTAFADQMPTWQTDASLMSETMIGPPAAKDFSARGPIAGEALVDTGTALYNDAFPIHKPMLTEKSAEGAAAGGVVREDENTRIWDDLLVPTGASLD